MKLEITKDYKSEEEVNAQIPSLSSYNETLPFPESRNVQYNDSLENLKGEGSVPEKQMWVKMEMKTAIYVEMFSSTLLSECWQIGLYPSEKRLRGSSQQIKRKTLQILTAIDQPLKQLRLHSIAPNKPYHSAYPASLFFNVSLSLLTGKDYQAVEKRFSK